jgi:hypothetical protein
MAAILYLINQIVPPSIPPVSIPGLNIKVGTLVGIITFLFTSIFLIRALSDALVLGDIATDLIVKRLGIEEEQASKRIARDAILIIIIILVATAIFPLFKTLEGVGDLLATAATYISFGIMLILFYDIGRLLYRMVTQKTESIADRLAKILEKE